MEHVVTNYVTSRWQTSHTSWLLLWKSKQMMINCQRPLVIYESMEVEFTAQILATRSWGPCATFDVEGKAAS
ncbi:DUF3581 family protein [Vibrio lentus]|nr:DUF3581 family protein [Vibrio lentus]